MNLCIPVTEDKGLASPVAAHFGSAPLFVIVDTDNGSCRLLPDTSVHDDHGTWQPLVSLAGEQFDGIAVGGIGTGALKKLQAANVRVFATDEATVEDTIAAFKAGKLREATPATASAQQGHDPQGLGHQEHGPRRQGPHGAGPHGHGPHGHGPQGHGHAGPRGNRGGRG